MRATFGGGAEIASSPAPSAKAAGRGAPGIGLLLAATWLLCSAMLLVGAWHVYPVPDGDARFFLPAIRSLAATGNLENRTVLLSFQTDPEGLGRFLFYPRGFVFFVGTVARLAGITDYPGLLVLLTHLRAAGGAALALALYHVCRQRGPVAASGLVNCVAAATLASNLLFRTASAGRPELLTLSLAAVAGLAGVAGGAGATWIIAALTALVCSFSIANGIIAGIMFGLYLFFVEDSFPRALGLLLVTGALGLLLFMTSFPVTGVDPALGLRGIMLHARQNLSRDDTSLSALFAYWQSWFPFALLAGGFVIRQGISRWKACTSLAWRCYAVAFTVAFVAAVFFFGLRIAPADYNINAFLPLYQLLSFVHFVQSIDGRTLPTSGSGVPLGISAGGGHGLDAGAPSPAGRPGVPRLPRNRGVWLGRAVLFAAVMASQPLCLQFLAFPHYASSGGDYRSMSKAFRQVVAAHPGRYLYTSGLTVLDGDLGGNSYEYRSESPCSAIRPDQPLRDDDRILVFVQEKYAPPAPGGHARLVADFTDKGPPPSKLRGVRILRKRVGLSFRAYEVSCAGGGGPD